jgi:hypothetical protein
MDGADMIASMRADWELCGSSWTSVNQTECGEIAMTARPFLE